ncbi:hypothetical protein QCN29_34955 [Streptomyces sp. HNM0663]|uniref:Uncharacterized protein n=1 Tax=Streptomyces chengmaiensis TaxID=3040919 RepID=A0ABT6HYR8_9ACTN|nr:hypothetical protein [Streptomyces chengmaiensis]MDH2393866.1 hypothetical protein [Streptomyces chengmaiensis]
MNNSTDPQPAVIVVLLALVGIVTGYAAYTSPQLANALVAAAAMAGLAWAVFTSR